MNPKGVRLIKGKEPLLRQLIFELRYQHGFSYLDRCGKVLNRITRDYPEWLVGNEVNPQGAPLYSMRNRCRFTFSSSKLDLSLDYTAGDQPITDTDRDQFVHYVGALSRIVIDELGLTVFARMGLRALYYFPSDNREDSEAWLKELGVFKLSDQLTSAFAASVDAASLAIILIGSDCRYRIAFNGVETSAQLDMGAEILTVRASTLPKDQKKHLLEQLRVKRQREINSGYAVVIDVDAYHEDPPSPDPEDFARKNASTIFDMIRNAIS